MVVNATPKMLPRMNDLWNRYFGDSQEYSSFFFQWHLIGEDKFENQYVYIEDNQPVSMLSVLEADIICEQKVQRFWYVYAVVTDEQYRKRGYAGKVLEHVLKKAKEQNAAVGLVPANEKLYSFYQKAGFEPFFYHSVRQFVIHERAECEVKLTALEPEEYKKLRDMAYQKLTYVRWNQHAVEYALKENANMGGQAYGIAGTPYFFLVCPAEEELLVRETNLPLDMLEIVCSLPGVKSGCKRATIIGAASSSEETVKHGMIYNYSFESQSGYLGLALD